MNYFNKLPTISYQGQTAKNLLARAKLSDNTRANKLAFHKHVTNNDRIDTLSYEYYDSPGYSWLTMLSNDTIDPYYGFAIPETEFNEYIKLKYGNLRSAQRQIVQFRINWDLLDNQISPSQYEQSGPLKKYYTPVLDGYLQIQSYILKTAETAVTSNLIGQLSVTNLSGTFVVGEEIQQTSSIYGFVASEVSDNSMLVKNLVQLGSTFTPGATLTGSISGATATVDSFNILSRGIPENEIAFWEPVSAYTLEFEANEKRKNIKLLDARYKGTAESELKRLMGTR